MLLADYLTSQNLAIPEFADLIGRSSEGVRLWVKGQRMPGTVDIAKIHQITNGQACANDLHAACVLHRQALGTLPVALQDIAPTRIDITESSHA